MFRLCDFQIKRPEWGEAVRKAPGADACSCGSSLPDASWAFTDLMMEAGIARTAAGETGTEGTARPPRSPGFLAAEPGPELLSAKGHIPSACPQQRQGEPDPKLLSHGCP